MARGGEGDGRVRSVPEWIGKDDDEPVPARVRLRVFDDKHGRCHRCGRKVGVGGRHDWTLEHMRALINGGKNAESNLDLTCSWCLPEKNAEDVNEKSRVYSLRSKHVGAVEKPKWRKWR